MLLNRNPKKNSRLSYLIAIPGMLLLSGLALWIFHVNPLFAVTERKVSDPQRFVQTQETEIVPHVEEQRTEMPPVSTSKNRNFSSASRRMQQAQSKMEAAREEMLEAAEAMRQAKEMAGCIETMDCEEMQEMPGMHDNTAHQEIESEIEKHGERIHREHQRVVRQVEREVLRNEKRKVIRVVPYVADLPSHEPRLPRVPRAPLNVLPQLAPPSTPRPAMQPKVASPEQPPTPPTPEIAPEPNFESYPMPEYESEFPGESEELPEYEPELPDEPEPPEQEF